MAMNGDAFSSMATFMEGSGQEGGWLEGITVVDLSATAPGPYCTSLLARMGARVIKFESPAGDVTRMFPAVYEALNQGKESVVVDLKRDEDVQLVRAVAARADVVIEGWRPGVAERLRVGPADLWSVNPNLVYCSISGYGQEGSLRDKPGHDLNYVAASGFLRLLFEEDPRPLGVPVADLAGGTFAAMRVLGGLFATARGAQRIHVDVSVTGAVRDWVEVVGSANGGSALKEVNDLPHYGVFETADGHHLTLAVVHEEAFWSEICRVLGRDEWAELSIVDRSERSFELTRHIAKLIKERTRADLERELAGADTCWAFVDSPPQGTQFEGMVPRSGSKAPTLGVHTRGVWAEFAPPGARPNPER